MKTFPGTLILCGIIIIVFAIEIVTNTMGNEVALLSLGALPTNGQLNGEYWRIVTYAFLHFNWTHIALNLALLYWTGRIVERRVGTAQFVLVFGASMILSGITILVYRTFVPVPGSGVGASGGAYGVLAAALILAYRRDALAFGQDRGLRLGLWLALLIGIAVSFIPGVSIAGHLSGLMVGALIGLVVKVRNNPNLFQFQNDRG
jgi:rhomboid protease GluP